MRSDGEEIELFWYWFKELNLGGGGCVGEEM